MKSKKKKEKRKKKKEKKSGKMTGHNIFSCSFFYKMFLVKQKNNKKKTSSFGTNPYKWATKYEMNSQTTVCLLSLLTITPTRVDQKK